MVRTKNVELYRLLDDNTWDTFVTKVPAKATRADIERHIQNKLLTQSRHIRVVHMGIYNEDLGDGPEDRD